MRILYLITGMFNSAGMERTVANKANYFTERGHEVTIVTTDQCKREYFYDISPKVIKVDFNINFSENDGKDIIIRVLMFYRKNWLLRKKLKEYLYQNRQDIVVTLVLKSVSFLYKINDSSVKIVEHHFARDIYSQQGIALQWNLLERMIYKVREHLVIHHLKKYPCFAVLTHEDAIEWKKCLDNVIVMPNSISYHKDLIAPLKNKIVISIGRLDYQKGYDIFLPIWKNVVSKHPEWKFDIYGNGVMKDYLLNKVRELDLMSSVRIHDSIADVTSVLMEGGLYVLPSRYEGLPMVMLESMSVGLPVIAFRCKCGPSELIEDGKDGYLIDCFDSQSFAKRMNYLIENKEIRMHMGMECKRKMINYSHDVICKRWEDLFQDLIKDE